MSKENLCKIDWTRESNNPNNPGVLSTRKIEFVKDDEIRMAFRLCLERQGISDAEMMRDNVVTHLYVTIFGSNKDKEAAFEKKFDAKTLTGFYAERRKVECPEYVRFHSEDARENSKRQFKAGDPVKDTKGEIIVYDAIDVDVLTDEKGELMYGMGNAQYTAKGNLQYQVEQGWAEYADVYFGGNGDPAGPMPQNTEPPIVPPATPGGYNGQRVDRGSRR